MKPALWWGMVKVTLSKANATALPEEGILAMTCISNQCEILVMARILQQMRNIGDDAHFQEMRNELSKNQASDMDFVPANLPIPGITKS